MSVALGHDGSRGAIHAEAFSIVCCFSLCLIKEQKAVYIKKSKLVIINFEAISDGRLPIEDTAKQKNEAPIIHMRMSDRIVLFRRMST